MYFQYNLYESTYTISRFINYTHINYTISYKSSFSYKYNYSCYRSSYRTKENVPLKVISLLSAGKCFSCVWTNFV